jgi:predicted DNA-binding protein YlxM (UPF0122 family)
LERLAEKALLADFYGPLLTEKQRNVWELHYAEDLSLSEIAEMEGISRQAVHDLLKRTERILTEYEEKLRLIERFLLEREAFCQALALLKPIEKEHFADADIWRDFVRARETIIEALAEFNGIERHNDVER